MFEKKPVSLFGLRHNLSRTLPALAVSLASFLAPPSLAATINVTANAPDVLNGSDGKCSLREAIYNINNGGASGSGTIGSGTITFADCAYTDVFGTSDTINIPAGKHTITIPGKGETFNATGDYNIRKSVSIAGAGASHTIISGGKLDRVFQVAASATVTFSGVAIQDGDCGVNCYGGGINNVGTLTITNSTVSGNTAAGNWLNGGYGGGIQNYGTTTITNSTISGNTAAEGGGIESNGPLSVTNSTISGNSANMGGGGGMRNSDTTNVTNSTISGNTAVFGGGIHSSGIIAITTITNSIISGNKAVMNGLGTGFAGGIYSTDAIIIVNSTISGNTATGDGGGIITGRGISSITNSTISGNTATRDGGGIWKGTATLTVTNSTISGNTATSNGGGIWSGYPTTTLTVINSTISGNSTTMGEGGGIFSSSGSLTVASSTITANSSPAGGGVFNLSTSSFSNSIVAKQVSGGDCHVIGGSITSTGHNIESSATCGFSQATDKQNTDPLLASLGNNGGPTMTHALISGSPAINAGSCVQATDQRGVARPQGPGCDIGAFEAIASEEPSSSTPSPSTPHTSTTQGVSTSPYINAASSTSTSSASGGASTVTITNSGANAVLINSIGGAGFTISADNCSGQSIAANGTCQVTVTPASSVSSEATVTLMVYTNSQLAPVEITLKVGSASSSSTASSVTLGSPADGSTTGSTVTLEWEPAGNGGYQLYLCQNMDFSGCDAIAVSGGASANRALFAGAGLIFALGLVAPGGRRRMFIMALSLALGTGMGLAACGSGGSSSASSNGNVTYTASNLASGTWFWKVVADSQESETRRFSILAHSK